MQLDEAAEILEEILQEEKDADEHLNDIALRALNPQAAGQEGEEEPEDSEEEPEPEPEPVEQAPKRRRARAKA